MPEHDATPTGHETAGTEAAPHHAEFLGINAEGYVALAFLIFVALLLYLKVPKMIAGALDGRAAKVRGELAEAKQLRADAEALLAGYRAKADQAGRDAEAIVANARTEAANIVADAQAAAAGVITRRQAMAETKIAAAERTAEAAVRARAVDAATQAAAAIIAGRTDPAESARLTGAAITELERRLH